MQKEDHVDGAGVMGLVVAFDMALWNIAIVLEVGGPENTDQNVNNMRNKGDKKFSMFVYRVICSITCSLTASKSP